MGSSPLVVTELGRWIVSGNTGTHTVQLFNADGTPVPNGSVSLNTSGKTAGQFADATLASAVTLAPGTTYGVMSSEVSGGDRWYDLSGTTITLGAAASDAWAAYASTTIPPMIPAAGGSGRSYRPVNLKGSTTAWTLSKETRYVYDGMRVIQERDGGNVPTVSYTRGNDLSGSLEGAGGIGGLLARSHGYTAGTGAWTTHSFYHADGNGNITALANASQALVAQYRYDPYGNTLTSSGTLATANTMRFSSKQAQDIPSLSLYYYGYRFYEPSVQRWLNRDLLGENRGINLYGFLQNKPLTSVDSLGLASISITLLPSSEPPYTIKKPPGIEMPPGDGAGGVGGMEPGSTGHGNMPVIKPPTPCRAGEKLNVKQSTFTCPCTMVSVPCESGSVCKPMNVLVPSFGVYGTPMTPTFMEPYHECERCPEGQYGP